MVQPPAGHHDIILGCSRLFAASLVAWLCQHPLKQLHWSAPLCTQASLSDQLLHASEACRTEECTLHMLMSVDGN